MYELGHGPIRSTRFKYEDDDRGNWVRKAEYTSKGSGQAIRRTIEYADDLTGNQVLLLYTISNRSEARLDNLYCALYFDWDLGPLGLDNEVQFDPQNRMGTMRNVEGNGLPVVASPVGVNSDIVRDGENGFLVTTPEQWRGALLRLIDDAALRRRMGDAGRARAVEHYSLASQAPRLVEIFKSVATPELSTR